MHISVLICTIRYSYPDICFAVIRSVFSIPKKISSYKEDSGSLETRGYRYTEVNKMTIIYSL